ncbi:MAG TPA: hypothetical protein VFX45_07420 [Solirubrobacterales bacterium]|nr:hypothetical protein [Solirubrobacterales bacterium]
MGSGLVARNGGRLGVAVLAAILLLGLGLRVGEAWNGRAPVYDAAAYAAIAENLADGDGFTVGAGATQPSSNYSPGLPLFVAGIYEVTGPEHERTARVVLALIGTLAVLLTYLIGRRLSRVMHFPPHRVGNASLDVVAGLVGAGAVAVYPALLEYQGMLMSEPLAATLLAGAVLAILWAGDGGSLLRWLWPGALLGALALVRPEYLGIAVLLALVIFGCGALRGSFFAPEVHKEPRVGWQGWLARAAALLVGVAVVVAPWTVRNAVALDRFVPISTGGGQVLFAGTYLPSDGDPEKVGAEVVAENPQLFSSGDAERLRLEQILAVLAAAEHPELEIDKALSRMGREQLWDDVSEEPAEYAGFLAQKLWRVWGHGPRDVMHEPGWALFHWALVAFGLIGLAVLAWRRRWEALVIATVLLSITAVSLLLVASPRRALVLLPLTASLAGVGAVWMRDSLSRP